MIYDENVNVFFVYLQIKSCRMKDCIQRIKSCFVLNKRWLSSRMKGVTAYEECVFPR